MKKVFIDCGAHCGESILLAKRRFGNDIQVVSFEAVPMLAESLMKLYEGDNSVQICNAAVYINDGEIDINISPAFTDGSSILSTLNDNHKAKRVSVPCFDLSTWISNTFTPEDYLILKLDIEGAEYEVLRKLIADNTIQLVDELWGEWHYGHIINNITDDVQRETFTRIDTELRNKLIELNKPLQIWEAYYSIDTKLTKRPTSLYE